LTGTSITDKISSSILQASSELLELHLTGTQISEMCVPDVTGLRKLKYIAFPLKVSVGLATEVYCQLKGCLSLTTLDCQEGYFFDQEEIKKIVRNDSQLTS